MTFGANSYKKTAVTTASPSQVLIMLYEAAIRYTKKSIEALEKNDVAAKGLAIGKVHDIVNELNNTLNHEVGGHIARDLERLYNYMTEQLIQANLHGKIEPLQSVLKSLETLLDGWKGAIEKVNRETMK